MNFLASHWLELGVKVWQQLVLVGLSTLLAVLIGVSLGLVFAKRPKISHLMISSANVIQTIPSLALLTFLLPLLGIGLKPALTALTLYALLPILSNTLIGLQNVPHDLKQAALALGFTTRQQLCWVELPLALPIIVTGIKTAVVINVGVATLAAFIGAGGLGDFINQGLALNNNALLLLGAIPAAMLALILDGLLNWLARTFAHDISTKKRNLQRLVVLFSLLLLIGLSWRWSQMSQASSPHSSATTIRIATKNFTESIILGEIMAQTIEAKTALRVERQFNLGSIEICQQALLQNKIDLYPEYTGTAYLMVLHGKQDKPAQALYHYVQNAYAQRFHLTWLAPFGFNNTEAIAVREDFAQKNHLSKISDLVAIEHQLIAGVPSELLGRADGIPGLQRVYQLQFNHIYEMSMSLRYQAIQQGYVNVISAFSTDGQIQQYKLTLLQDDKHLFPAYDAAIVARAAVLHNHPELQQALQSLSGLIADKDMRALNYQVDVMKNSPHSVAHDFLTQHGII